MSDHTTIYAKNPSSRVVKAHVTDAPVHIGGNYIFICLVFLVECEIIQIQNFNPVHMYKHYSFNTYLCCSIDASHSQQLARYVNDSPRQYANCFAKALMISSKPHVILIARKDIEAGTELRYDYGGGSLLWRKVGVHALQFQYECMKLNIAQIN
jgi:hypothetical protein